ncbi:hypothetical protein BDV39DRAFT_170617 [Aspergillus sergii]|uniref:Uncharacterized protein n=1 Tax=Aspergillus sergii TaxID=1034303 RepID=A0A5N6XC94_9EURO|nr:hypothetical protein BDV39DRAFT_170617 [Aspergillus sergii]
MPHSSAELRPKHGHVFICQNNLLYTQESLSRYRPGEYHPVTLGYTFKNGRYRVYHKLVGAVFLPFGLRTIKTESMGLVEDHDSRSTRPTRIRKYESSGKSFLRRTFFKLYRSAA